MSVNMESEMDFDDKKFYMNYLDGLTDDMPDDFFRLAQVFELNLFEPVRIDGSGDIYAAYIMNDAVESFFVFEQPVITGTYKDIESEQIAGVEKLDDGYMLIVNQGGENVFTIKFVKLSITSTYFNYGCMGHFWVNGYEYLRQLEYQFAVIREKYRFLGSSSCNEKELVFMRLADFPPVKKYRSVPKAYYVPYPDSIYPEAVSYLMETARSVGDRNMERMLKIYQKKPDSLKCNIIASMFHKKSHRRFIDNIINDMRDAASSYDRRKFDKEEEIQNRKIHEKALKIMNNFKQKGYECFLYREEPFVYLKDTITYKEHVLVFKNHGLNRKCDIYTITNDEMFYK